MWRKLLQIGLASSLIITLAFGANVKSIGEDNTAAAIQKNRLDMVNAISLLEKDASVRDDNAVLNVQYDYIYAIADMTLADGSLVEDIVTVTDVATVGTVTVDYDWTTDFWASEGSFTVTSPTGTTLTVGAGQSTGHYTVAIAGFSGEDLAGAWTFSVHDSYGDGGHTLANATMNVDMAATTPEISFSDATLDFGTLPVGLFASKTLTINNLGGGVLTVSSIAADDANFFLGDVSASVPAFGSVDITVGYEPSVAGDHTANLVFTSDDAGSPDTVALSGTAIDPITTGGPDLTGYTWVSSLDGAGPTFAWVDTVGATEAGIAFGDDIRGTIDIPFTFRFYGNLYTQLTATTNGWVGMGPSTDFASSYWTNTTIPSATLPDNIIAPLWDDFKAGDSPGSTSSAHGTIMSKTLGTEPNRQFVVIFDEIVRGTYDTDYFSFEVILDEATSDITIQYLDVMGNASADNGIGGTVGIENVGATDGLLYGYNGVPQLVYDEMAIKFIAPPPPALPNMVLDFSSIDFGTIIESGSATAEVQISNNGSGDLVIAGATVAAPFATTFSGTIAENTSAVATISFDPTTTGAFAETLTFTVTGEYSGDNAVSLTGSAYPSTYISEGFEDGFPPFGWTVIDVDGGSVFNPDLSYIDPHSGLYGAEAMGCADDYLITPLLAIPPTGYADFSFWHGQESTVKENSFEVMVSTTGTATTDFTQIADYPLINPPTSYAWSQESIDLSAYAGQEVYVAIHVYYSESAYYGFGFDDFLMPPLVPSTNTIFFSEYMEGSSNNKGLEIYNGTGATVNLNEYQIAQSSNGNGWAYYHMFPDTAILANDDVWLIVTDQSFPEMQAMADEILGYPSVVHHNGDDARALIHIVGTDTTFIDIIGTPDVDPGSGWDVAGVTTATANHNLVRKADVVTGNTDWIVSAGTNVDDSEWIVYEQNYWYGMGYHNEAYPLPGDACDMPLAYGAVNDAAATGTLESYASKWYSFTNDGSFDNVIVSLCESSFDTQIEVWESCDSATYIAYNDDACGNNSEVDLGALAAGDYLVRVYGYGSSSGDYSLSVTGSVGMPDFVVSDMVLYGDTLGVTVTNQGPADSPGYWGTDYHGWGIDGDYYGYVAETGVALTAGASYTYEITGFNFDNLGDGTFLVNFWADVDNDVAEADETNNADSLYITIDPPPVAPRNLAAVAGENEVSLFWQTAVLPEVLPPLVSSAMGGISDQKIKPAIVLSPEQIAKRDALRGNAIRNLGDTCAEAEGIGADSTIAAPYAPYWYSYTATMDGFMTVSSDGATVDTKVYIYDACDAAYIAYNDDGGSGLSSIVTFPTVSGTTYFMEWTDQWSASGFDWTLTEFAVLPMPDLAVTSMYFENEGVWAVVENLGDASASGQSSHWFIDGVDIGYVYTATLAPGTADTLGLVGFNWVNVGEGTFNVGIFVDFWDYLLESDETNNSDSIEVVITPPDYLPTYNVYRNSVLLVDGLEAANNYFDGEYYDMDVVADVTYEYFVTQNLPDSTESEGSESAFATPWAPIFWAFPNTEDFEAVTDNMLPYGFFVEELGAADGADWAVGDSAYFETNAYNYWHVPGHTQFAAIDDDGNGSGVNGNEILWTPWVDFSTAVNPQILFNYTVRGGNGAEFFIDNGDSTVVMALEDSPSAWLGRVFNLGEYAGQTVRFGFHYDDAGGWAYGLAVDDITVEEAPSDGTLAGTITDGAANPVAYAQVHVFGLFAEEGTMTDETGAYSVTVPAGEYQVDVMRVNYSPATTNVSIIAGETSTLDFTLEFLFPAPENLMVYPNDADTTIALQWAPPMPMGQVAYDDGTYEALYWVGGPTTSDHYFAAHFKAAITPGYAINEIAILTTSDDGESAFANVSVVSSDEFGGPDLANVLWTATGNAAAAYPAIAWDFYPVAANPAYDDFWVIMQWPEGNEFGPYVATDMDNNIGNSFYSAAPDTSGNPMWNMLGGTFGVRAFLSEPSTGRSVVLHGSETTTIEKVGSALALGTKHDENFAGSFEAPAMTTISRELLNYNVYRSLDPMAMGDVYATATGEMFTDASFDFDTQYFYAVTAAYDLGESGPSNVAGFMYFTPLYLNHYEGFDYADMTPLADIGWATDDGAGNPAANFGIEDQMLHFDWSPTATDFYQTATSPVADFAGATQARLGFYLFFDDYSDTDNGTLDFYASISNDGFVTETFLMTHNDSTFGNIEEYMIFDVSDVAAGSDGWQLRFTVTGATSFTMDHLWIDDVIVESDIYMGPSAFNLLAPSDAEAVGITTANVTTGSLLFAWESASDNAMYGVEISGSLGSVIVPFDTSATEVLIPFAAIQAAFNFAGVYSVEGTWNVVAFSGGEMLYSSNGPFALTIGTTVGTDNAFVPDVYDLFQNYPNPFNPTTSITYDVPESADVRLVVYNLLGQPVRVLVNNYQSPNRYNLEWNGLSDAGLPLSSGIYIYRLETEAFVKTMKMMYLK